MSNLKIAQITALQLSLLIGCVSAVLAAAPSFNQAVADYNASKYAQALEEFKLFVKAYPTNAQSHYYMALCYRSLGHSAEAKQEFMYASQFGDATLKGYSEKALKALGGTAGPRVNAPGLTRPGTGHDASGTKESTPAVVDLLEFTDDGQTSKDFEKVWSGAQSRASGVRFRQYKFADPANTALVKRYNVRCCPTLVFLDKDGIVLRNTPGYLETVDSLVKHIADPVNH